MGIRTDTTLENEIALQKKVHSYRIDLGPGPTARCCCCCSPSSPGSPPSPSQPLAVHLILVFGPLAPLPDPGHFGLFGLQFGSLLKIIYCTLSLCRTYGYVPVPGSGSPAHPLRLRVGLQKLGIFRPLEPAPGSPVTLQGADVRSIVRVYVCLGSDRADKARVERTTTRRREREDILTERVMGATQRLL